MCPKIKNHNVNRLVSLLVFISLTSFTYTFAGGTGQGATVHTLVIDPGHGGMDPGAIGPGGHHEADLALAVSLKFGEMVKQAFPDVKIIYTRTTDKFVSLSDRADMANKAKADLFICIHLNSATNHDAYGTSTYVLGLHRTDDNLEVAKRENAVIELEGDKDKNYEFDPNSPEGHIIMSMKQNAFLDQSILIASKIEDELAVLSKRKSRGVKQAGFWVLYKTAMPSLLAEIGFISNPSEEQYLSTDMGQANIAMSVFKAFRSYKYDIEGIKDTNALANQPNPEKKTEPLPVISPPIAQAISPPSVNNPTKESETTKQAPPKENQQPVNLNHAQLKKEEKTWQPDTSLAVVPTPPQRPDTIKSNPVEYKPIDKVAIAIIDTPSILQHGKVVISPEKSLPKTEKKPVPLRDEKAVKPKQAEPAISIPVTEPTKEPITHKEEQVAEVTKSEPMPMLQPKEERKPIELSQKAPAENGSPAPKSAAKEYIYFTVQLLAAKHKPGNYDDLVNTFGLMNREEITDGVVRYMAGEYANFTEANKALELAHSKGINDAFIVGYLNKKRLDSKATFQLGLRYP
jgi:N-acetylmuramoyl-L-alanine amidase